MTESTTGGELTAGTIHTESTDNGAPAGEAGGVERLGRVPRQELGGSVLEAAMRGYRAGRLDIDLG